MNSRQKVWLALLCMAVIGQVFYLVTIYRKEQIMIAANKSEIISNASKLDKISDQSLEMDDAKAQIEVIKSEKDEILNQLPGFESSSKEMMELIRYLNLNDFKDIEIKMLIPEEDQWKELDMIKRSYEIKWVGSFEETKNFIHKLNQSYQVLEIEKLEIDNEVQKLDEELNWKYYNHYKERFNEIVKVNLQLSLYERREAEEKEIYQPNLNLLVNSKHVFARSQKEEDLFKVEEQNLFVLSKELEEGNYRLSAPDGISVQLKAKTDISAYLIIRDDGYHMSLMNDAGEVQEISGEMEILRPQMKVISSSGNAVMNEANILITVHNQMQNEMVISTDEGAAGSIQLFDEQGKEVRRGYSNGKLKFIE